MNTNEQWTASVSRPDWSFHRKGERDQERHNEKVKESIKDNLDSVVSDGSIISVDPQTKKTIKVPMRSLELPRFRYGERNDGIGTGDGSEKPGDVIGRTKPGEGGKGEGAGDGVGEEYYEAELTIEEIQEMVFEDLGLPNVKPREANQIESEHVTFDDIRKKRSPSNLDIGRTVMQNMMRNAQESGRAEIKNISPDDYRVKMWQERIRPENNAVVVAMADISGSMDDFKKYLIRSFCWWSVGFLRSKYPKVELVFIAHDTEAYEVSEEQFFTRGMGGGTKCSSANRMALDIVKDRYPTNRFNVYPLHFSDGDNQSYDNPECISLVNQILEEDVNQYAYIQVGRQDRSNLLKDYDTHISDERFKGLVIPGKEDVLRALKEVFHPDETGGRS